MRLVTCMLALALAGLVAFFVFWTPYEPARLLRPIPADAAVVSLHDNLGPRLDSLLTNAFVRPLLGERADFLSQLVKHQRLPKIIAARSTALAFLPVFDRFTERGVPCSAPALVVTSWVGPWTPLLRWMLWMRPSGEILPAGNCNGHRLWAYRRPIAFCGSSAYFSFTLDEGIFIGCLSREGNGVARLLRVNEKVGHAGLSGASARLLLENTSHDRAIFKFNFFEEKKGQPLYALLELNALDNECFSVTAKIKPGIMSAMDGILPAVPATAEKICARKPVILAYIPSKFVIESINALAGASWQKVLRPLVAPEDANKGVCLLAVFTGEEGGRFGAEPFRIAVPTLLLAVSGLRPEQAKTAFFDLLGLMNTRYGLALAVNASLPPIANWQLYGIESTAGKLLRSMPPDDMPAYALYGDWFLLASNGAGLKKILIAMESGDRPAAEFWPRFPDGKRKPAFVRIDPGEGGKALRFGLMLAAIGLGEGAGSRDQTTMLAFLKTVRGWLAEMEGMRDISAWLDTDAGEMAIRIEIARGQLKK